MAFTNQPSATQPSMSEINVTPLVDVVLVLLIIFMVTAPILQTGIEVKLPETRTSVAVDPEQRAVISISRGELLYFRGGPVNFNELGDLLRGRLPDSSQAVFLQADEEVRWKTIVAVVDEIRVSGYETINLVTKPYSREEPESP